MVDTVVIDTKPVWLVWGNKDNTEGRGAQYIMYTCESQATAQRLCKKKYVMGSDAPIERAIAYKIGRTWYYPSELQRTSDQDREVQGLLDRVAKAVEKAQALGLTPEELKLLSIIS